MKINNNGNTFRTLLKTAVVGSLATGVGSQYFSTAPANQRQTCVTPEGVNKYGFETAPINAMNVTSVCLEEINIGPKVWDNKNFISLTVNGSNYIFKITFFFKF